jgi:DMSO/TMAO reductase YedYZ molybdopterin-dependent catalytic subunit
MQVADSSRGIVSRGFSGRPRGSAALPPGQYVTPDFPVLSAGPTPRVRPESWQLSITTETGAVHRWTWPQFLSLPAESVVCDIHCVTTWSKLATTWEGVSLDTLLADVQTEAGYALASSYGDYTTNLPLADLRDGKAWVVHRYDGQPLAPEHGGPARLLVPHLYLWKSAKWIRDIALRREDKRGFWENVGYHDYGDPWREQRYWGD